MPRSLMTTSLPRPRTVTGIARARAYLTRARSSNALWATANRSAGPPTRIVVNLASGSSRDVLTPIRRWMSVPVASGSNTAAVTPDPGRGAPESAGSGHGCPVRGGQDEVGDGVGRGRSAHRPGGSGHRDVGRGVVEDPGRVEQRVAVERLVIDEPGGARLDHRPGIGPLVAGRVRIRHDDDRAGRGRRPRPGWTSRPARRGGRRWPGRPACRRAGTGMAGSARVARPGAPRGRPGRRHSRRRRSRG